MTATICGTATGEQGTKTPGGNEVTYLQWAAPIMVVKKADDSIQLCADFSTGLNAALEDHQYPLPIPKDIFTILNIGTCFAKLDLTETKLKFLQPPGN